MIFTNQRENSAEPIFVNDFVVILQFLFIVLYFGSSLLHMVRLKDIRLPHEVGVARLQRLILNDFRIKLIALLTYTYALEYI